ncbi:MAG TPA: T9SS type A sorting domain-containing protein, partial [Anseongella sp.]|nr:T9SS type A sorting domain-containing protein [Anseongella sp.]
APGVLLAKPNDPLNPAFTLGGDGLQGRRSPSGNLFESSITSPLVNDGSGLLRYYVYSPSSQDIPLTVAFPKVFIENSNNPGTSSNCGTLPNIDPGVLTRKGNAQATVREEITKGYLGACYPNPASSQTLVPYRLPEGCSTATIMLRDLTGKVLHTYPLQAGQPEGEQEIDVKKLAKGLYIYSLTIDGRMLESKLLSITRE